jgi:transcriptional regulator with XRE-family HTH domain
MNTQTAILYHKETPKSIKVSHAMTTTKRDRYEGFAPTEFGNRVKRLRRIKGMTLEELGKKCGVKKTTVSQWETGRIKAPEGGTVIDLANALGVSPEWLIYGREDYTGSVVPKHAVLPEPTGPSEEYARDLFNKLDGLPMRQRVPILAALQQMLDNAQRVDDVKELHHGNGVARVIDSPQIRSDSITSTFSGPFRRKTDSNDESGSGV